MSFVTDDEKVYEKYNETWEIIRNFLKIDFTVNPVRDDINKTTFTNNAIATEKK